MIGSRNLQQKSMLSDPWALLMTYYLEFSWLGCVLSQWNIKIYPQYVVLKDGWDNSPGQYNIVVCSFLLFCRRAEERRMLYIRLSRWSREISCAHTTFYFFNFVKVIHSFGIFLWKIAEKYAVWYLLKIYSQQKWRLK